MYCLEVTSLYDWSIDSYKNYICVIFRLAQLIIVFITMICGILMPHCMYLPDTGKQFRMLNSSRQQSLLRHLLIALFASGMWKRIHMYGFVFSNVKNQPKSVCVCIDFEKMSFFFLNYSEITWEPIDIIK